MELIIAEKPSVAKAIREVLPSGSPYEVTHAVGHLLELAPPEHYNPALKQWNQSQLPIKISKWALLPIKRTKDQLETIGKLLKRASVVINAGDPDREGQLLIDEVLDYYGWKGPTKRLLVNATDGATIRKALSKMEDNAKYRPLMLSALCRQRSDWLVGMNLSRAVTKLLSREATISIGRVQTPTLAMVVRRQKEIEAFKSETFYTLEGTFGLSGGRSVILACSPDPRIKEEKVADAVARACVGKQTKLNVEVKKAARFAPLPFDLAEFQKQAEGLFGWSASKSLEVLQSTYEAKLTTYPRSDCRYLKEEQRDEALTIARKVAGELEVSEKTLGMMKPSDRVYDNKKVTEHHGIIPTGVMPTSQTPQHMRDAWKLVSLQFLASLLPNEQYEETKIKADVSVGGKTIDHLEFSARAERPLNPGVNWTIINLRAAFGRPESNQPKAQVIPSIQDGEDAAVAKCAYKEGKTSPPKPYTEATLIADMRAIAKFVQDPKLKSILKETSGIGTAATQAATIERLKSMGYVQIDKKNIIDTPLGREIIESIPPQMADPGITAVWEDALGLIARSQYDPTAFMSRIDVMIEEQVKRIRALREQGVAITSAKPQKGAGSTPKKQSSRPSSSARPSSARPSTRRGSEQKGAVRSR